MTSPQPNARRRYLSGGTPTSSGHPFHNRHGGQKFPSIDPLKKSATFHSPTTPSSPDDDPIVNIPLLPRRSPTCPKALEDAVTAGEKRIAQLLGVVDRSLSGLESFSSDSQDTLRVDDLPVPRFMLDAHIGETDNMDIDHPEDPTTPPTRQFQLARKHHTSDSGIGSTVTGSDESWSKDHAEYKKHEHNEHNKPRPSVLDEIQSGINGSTASSAGSQSGVQHALSEYACRQIQKHIILPIVSESALKDFHPLVTGIPYRVGRKEITCLRDLEKVLLWLAPKWSVSRSSFLKFCETSIQCIHTTVEYLNEPDQRRPTDRPYTNGYFLDLTEQVRQYAAMITATRERMAAGKGSDDDISPGEHLSLHGGLSETGRPVELVRIKNGQSISLRTGSVIEPEKARPQGLGRSMSPESDDDDVMRSMARRRKSAQAVAKDVQQCRECEKVFKRPCDLTKHEKTHSRPWKCSESSCKYHHYGWPTEKERDRHVNDKHSVTPSMYRCQYHPCPYESKRESNCKQHMEKAHGWAYVRSKNNGKTSKKPKNLKTPPTPLITTPGSCIFDASSPEYGETSTSYDRYGEHGVSPSVNGSTMGSEDSGPLSATETPFATFGPFNPNFSWNESYNGITPAGPSEYTPSVHGLSWDGESMLTNGATNPSSFETSLTPTDQDPLFGDNFDWSNMDYTSMNIQLVTPASSIETRCLDAFSRNPSISLEEPPSGQIPSLSPGAQGNVMLYSPYSNNERSVDEGYEEFTTDVGKPANDFALFDCSQATSGLRSTSSEQMFQDLATFVPTGWSGRGTDLAQQLGMNDLMQVDEE